MKGEICATSKETLESFGLTATEFFNKLTIGKGCSGLSQSFTCTNIRDCPICPIDSNKNKDDILDWLNLELSMEVTTEKRTTNQRLDSLEEKLDTLINLLIISNERKEV